MTSEQLKRIVEKLSKDNYPFGSFLRSFSEMHKCLTRRPEDFGKIDFKERGISALDNYALVAIRAEGCLMFPLLKADELGDPKNSPKGLQDYIQHHAEKRGVPSKALTWFRENIKRTKLHDRPGDPIKEIMKLNSPTLSATDNYLVRAFLCCLLARNYFAHHFYNDHEMLKSEDSAFLLGGILSTVLYLLDT